MEIGVFGKLPDQRDYVQHGMDPSLMSLMDPWIQQCLQRSQEQLADAWLSAYLSAPIWRFWLGSAILGKTVLGALMPSVDGVGRYFPLMLTTVSDAPLDAPEVEPQDAWFQAAESLLLDALADGGTYRALLDGLGDMPVPTPGRLEFPPVADCKASLANLRLARQQEFYGPLSFWWAPSFGHEGAPTTSYVWRGLPSAQEYAMLLNAPVVGHPGHATGGA